MLSRFNLIPERFGRTDGRTDRQTDGQICYINIARQYADAIKTGAADLRRRIAGNIYNQPQYLQMPTNVPNFHFLVLEICRGPKIKIGTC